MHVHGDNTLGGMIICESSEQARKLYKLFDEIQDEINAESTEKIHLKKGLILYDSDDKETRNQLVKDFKKNMTIDVLIVFNMLLTGFDAPRLKRLYFGRKLKDHNLLQALTRVNRPYKNNRYGYVIDFADIKRNFDETNAAYLKELNKFNDRDETGLRDLPERFIRVIEDKEALIEQMKDVQQALFDYTTDNAEEFSKEISTIEDKQVLLNLKKALIEARDCCNIVRTFGDDDLKAAFAKMELKKLPEMISEIQHRINMINQKEAFESDDATQQLVFETLKDIEFKFSVVGKEEMKLVSGSAELQEKWGKTIRAFTENFDQEDPEFITLREAFRQRFKEHGFVVETISQFEEHSKALDEILEKLAELQKRNKALLSKYNGDVKFARIHKRIREENEIRKSSGKLPVVAAYDQSIMDVLKEIKSDIDQKVYDRNDILKKDAYFGQTVMHQIKISVDKQNIPMPIDDWIFIRDRVTKEYLSQYNELYATA